MDGNTPSPSITSSGLSATGESPHDRVIVETHSGSERIALIADSFRRVTGNTLLPPDGNLDPASAIWRAPMVVLAHGTEADPVFFYGNRLALDLFEASADAFINLPSRFSAEPMERQERARFLAQVADHNCITDYSGIRISQTGKRFRIERATVWNLLDADGAIHGQAACFDRWTPVT